MPRLNEKDTDMNGLKLYCKSMGKIFRVVEITHGVDEANKYCKSHTDCGVIASNKDNSLIFIAELYEINVEASVLPD